MVAAHEAARSRAKRFGAIAEGLNRDGVPTAQGGRRWYPATVRYVAARAEQARSRRNWPETREHSSMTLDIRAERLDGPPRR
jgi:hypothetical protein